MSKVVLKKKAVATSWRPQIRSRHPSHDRLRKMLPKMSKRSIIRLGSTTEVEDGIARIEVNSVESIKNSSDKLRMKNCFTTGDVRTAQWWVPVKGGFVEKQHANPNNATVVAIGDLPYPLVAKHRHGSRGRGNTLIKSSEQFQTWLAGKTNLSDYIFERFYNYNREYRLHVTSEGCFYTCRKMLKEDTPDDKRWYRNDSNCVWIMEENENFNRPTSWNLIVEHSVRALRSCGLDFGACDVRVQSANTEKGNPRKEVDFIIVEINSAPSFGEVTLQRYLEVLPQIITSKIK